MLERNTLKQLIDAAAQAAQHEDEAARKYMALSKQAEAQAGRHRTEAGALRQLLELYYSGEIDKREIPF